MNRSKISDLVEMIRKNREQRSIQEQTRINTNIKPVDRYDELVEDDLSDDHLTESVLDEYDEPVDDYRDEFIDEEEEPIIDELVESVSKDIAEENSSNADLIMTVISNAGRLKDGKVTPSILLTLLFLLVNNERPISIKAIAHNIGFGISTIERNLKFLREYGYLRVAKNSDSGITMNIYDFTPLRDKLLSIGIEV